MLFVTVSPSMGEPVSGGASSHQHRPWESGKNFTRTAASEGVVGSPTSLVEIFDTAFGSEVDQPTDDCIGKSIEIILKSGCNFICTGDLIFLNHKKWLQCKTFVCPNLKYKAL